ncbi:unnamed protein product, partial [Polarella glacialis]
MELRTSRFPVAPGPGGSDPQEMRLPGSVSDDDLVVPRQMSSRCDEVSDASLRAQGRRTSDDDAILPQLQRFQEVAPSIQEAAPRRRASASSILFKQVRSFVIRKSASDGDSLHLGIVPVPNSRRGHSRQVSHQSTLSLPCVDVPAFACRHRFSFLSRGSGGLHNLQVLLGVRQPSAASVQPFVSNDMQINELTDNECVTALRRDSNSGKGDSESRLKILSLQKDMDVNLHEPVTRRRLMTACKLTKRLFNAFDTGDKPKGAPAAQLGRRRMQQARAAAAWLVSRKAFTAFYVVLTMYALFVPDIVLAHGMSARYTPWLAGMNTMVMCLFGLEGVLNSLAYPGYACSGRFWIDLLATLSMLGDTALVQELFATDGAAAGEGSRLMRVLRLSGRSTRLLRLTRAARVVQILRFIPLIMLYMDTTKNDLAMLLVCKRIWRIFQFLDQDCKGYLDTTEQNLFNLAMLQEFGEDKHEFIEENTPRNSHGLAEKGFKHSTTMQMQRSATFITSLKKKAASIVGSVSVRPDGQNTFHNVADDFLGSPEGKRAITACKQELKQVKASYGSLHRASGKMALKICILVLV